MRGCACGSTKINAPHLDLPKKKKKDGCRHYNKIGGMCICAHVCVCSILDQFVPVSVCGREYSMSAAGSTQAAAERERERERK